MMFNCVFICQGHFFAKEDAYHVDPVDDHFPGAKLDYDHIIYRLSDMDEDLFVFVSGPRLTLEVGNIRIQSQDPC